MPRDSGRRGAGTVVVIVVARRGRRAARRGGLRRGRSRPTAWSRPRSSPMPRKPSRPRSAGPKHNIDAPLEIVRSPTRDFTDATLRFIDEIEHRWPNTIVTVLIPELFVSTGGSTCSTTRASLLLKGRLLFRKRHRGHVDSVLAPRRRSTRRSSSKRNRRAHVRSSSQISAIGRPTTASCRISSGTNANCASGAVDVPARFPAIDHREAVVAEGREVRRPGMVVAADVVGLAALVSKCRVGAGERHHRVDVRDQQPPAGAHDSRELTDRVVDARQVIEEQRAGRGSKASVGKGSASIVPSTSGPLVVLARPAQASTVMRRPRSRRARGRRDAACGGPSRTRHRARVAAPATPRAARARPAAQAR